MSVYTPFKQDKVEDQSQCVVFHIGISKRATLALQCRRLALAKLAINFATNALLQAEVVFRLVHRIQVWHETGASDANRHNCDRTLAMLHLDGIGQVVGTRRTKVGGDKVLHNPAPRKMRRRSWFNLGIVYTSGDSISQNATTSPINRKSRETVRKTVLNYSNLLSIKVDAFRDQEYHRSEAQKECGCVLAPSWKG